MSSRVDQRVLRTLRTVRGLRPVQVAARPYALLMRQLAPFVPGALPPSLRSAWSESLPAGVGCVGRIASSEWRRMETRTKGLVEGSLLRRYEQCYGFADAAGEVSTDDDPVAFHPFPASVRARNLAVATRRGFPVDAHRLARACRAILAQPEIHLLGNHWLENGIGLACAGCATIGPEADLWWRVGSAIVGRELHEQFLDDGGHFERSASYHLWLTAALLTLLHLAQAAGRTYPNTWTRVAERALGWVAWVRAPDGTFPLLNDASLDASALPDDVLAFGSTLGLEPQQHARVLAHGEGKAVVLAETGWCVLQQPGAWLVIDAGPDGAPYQPGHVHADALTFELWIEGERTVVDYGVSSYIDDEERRRTRATRSHNTVELDGENSSEVWGAFRVGRRAEGTIRRLEAEGEALVAVCEHDGYRWMPRSPIHRRLVRLGAKHLDVEDRFDCESAISSLRCDVMSAQRYGFSAQSEGASARTIHDAWYPTTV